MMHEEETMLLEPERTRTAYRRDLYRVRLVIGRLWDATMVSGEPVQVADLALAPPPTMSSGTAGIEWTATFLRKMIPIHGVDM